MTKHPQETLLDKRPFSFRQTVRHTDLNGLQDDLERALDARTRELLGAGIVTGGAVTPCDSPQQAHVCVAPTLAWDRRGRRIAIRRRFIDRVDAVIPLSALRQEEVADIPQGDGCLICLAKAASGSFSLPFQLAGKTAMLGTDADDARAHDIHAVVQTTLGGLVPKQPVLLLRDDLPQQGYAPGGPPTGTPLTIEGTDTEPVGVDLNKLICTDKNTALLVPKGQERIVTLIARFARDLFDHRLDGHGESVPHRAADHFALVVDNSAAPAKSGQAKPPPLPQAGVLLADIRLRHGQPVTREDIDISRQTRLRGLQELFKRMRQDNEAINKQLREVRDLVKHAQSDRLLFKASMIAAKDSWQHFSLPINVNAVGIGADTSYRACRVGVGSGICYTKYRNSWFKAGADEPISLPLNAVACSYPFNWLAVGDKGSIYFSPGDLKADWRRVPNNDSPTLNACAALNSRWILVGDGGIILSLNGTELQAWAPKKSNKPPPALTVHDNPAQVSLRCVAGNLFRVVVAGDDGVLLFSKDGGASWHQAQLDSTSRDTLKGLQARRLIWDKNSRCFCVLFLSPSSGGTSHYLYTSPDGELWRPAGKDFHLSDLACGDSLCVVAHRGGSCLSIGMNWTDWYASSLSTGTNLGERIVYDHFYRCFCRFKHGGNSLWESCAQLPRWGRY